MDGVDCVLIKSDGNYANVVGKAVHIPYDHELRHKISQGMAEAIKLGHPSKMTEHLYILEKWLTDIHGDAVAEILSANGLTSDNIDVVGFHGQTLLHKPDERFSWQIGDGQRLANLIQIPVVNDFRRKDVEHGGQGAPLVPIYHHALIKGLSDPDYPIAIVNIGGVSNITWMGSEKEGHMLAFDTGPGNAFLDDWIAKHTGDPMDRDGMISREGTIDAALVEQWLDNGYFHQPPPKSLDRNGFILAGLEGLSLADGAATLLEFTVKSIHTAITHCPKKPKHIYICGGGRHNKTLMAGLERYDIPVSVVEKIGWQGDFLEAEAFAFLACRHLKGLPITFPGTTGVSQSSLGGVLYKPEKN